MLLTAALQSRFKKKQSSFTLSFSFLNLKPCFALHIATLSHLHTRDTQLLNMLPSGSAVPSTMGILLPGPTNASFPSALPSPLFCTKTNFSSGKGEKNSSACSPAQTYSIFLGKPHKLIGANEYLILFHAMPSFMPRMTMLFSECIIF